MNRLQLISDLKRDEGVILHEYKDSAGYSTIGIGRLIDKKGGGITLSEAEYMLGNDIQEVEHQLDGRIPWWRTLTEPRQRALANMCFNLGITRLMGFKKALGHLQAGRYEEAAEEFLDSKWAVQVGDRAQRIATLIK